MELKTCPICKQDKPLSAYYVRRRPRLDGGVSYQHGCRACRTSQTLDWQAQHPERVRSIGKMASLRYYRTHGAEIRQRAKAKLEANREAMRAKWRAAYAARKAKRRAA